MKGAAILTPSFAPQTPPLFTPRTPPPPPSIQLSGRGHLTCIDLLLAKC